MLYAINTLKPIPSISTYWVFSSRKLKTTPQLQLRIKIKILLIR